MKSLCVLIGLSITLAFGETSLYELNSKWQRDDGKSMVLQDLRGKPQLLTFFFSHCESICPMLLGQLKLLEKDMPEKMRDQIGFTLFTMDLKRDSVESLRDFRERMGFSRDRWTLLRGNEDDTRELAFLLGIDYQEGKRGQMDHNGLIALIDSEGKVVEKVTRIEDRQAFLKILERTMKTTKH